MKEIMQSILTNFKKYPFSMGAFFLSLLPWILVTLGYFNIKLNPPLDGGNDYRGEGLFFGAVLGSLIAIILIIISILNLIIQKNKAFYAWLIFTTIMTNLAWYAVFSIY